MSFKTKAYYSERILNELQPGLQNRDSKIDPREVILFLDDLVNEYARQGWLDNWKFGATGLGEQYITTWTGITITDPANGMPSYFPIPARYVELPKQQGIQDVMFDNDFSAVKKRYFNTVLISSFKDVAAYRNNLAGGNPEGYIVCYPKGGNMYFVGKGNIGALYGKVGIRLAIKDSSSIGDNDPYPIDAAIEAKVLAEAVQHFRERKSQQLETIRDNNPKT